MAQTLSVTLDPSDYNGYAVSCFGEKDGAISAQVTGGTPPYEYSWSSGQTVPAINDVPAGYYSLRVSDAAGGSALAEIMLLEPNAIKVGLTPVVYPNDYNISCWECHNGMIYVDVYGGASPYTYVWNDGLPGSMRTGLGAKQQYSVEVTDSNGCTAKTQKINLTQPERNDWGMTGNAGTDASVHYIGSSDAQDVVFKSNGQEVVRLTSDGDLKLLGPSQEFGPVFRMEDGTLRGGRNHWPELPPEQCRADLGYYPYWETQGNSFDQVCPDQTPLLGTLGARPLNIITNGTIRMIVSPTGKVGIGTSPPAGPVDGYRLFVDDGIATRDVMVKLGTWPDYVFADNYRLMPLNELRDFLKRNKHLPGIPSAATLEEQGGVAVGEMQRNLVRTVEEQALYILELEERLEQVEQRLGTLQTSK